MKLRSATIFIASWSFVGHCAGEDLIADVRQGTNMALALAPDGETIIVSGLLCDGAFDLQVESGPRKLALNIYSAIKIERLICNGQEVKPGRTGADL